MNTHPKSVAELHQHIATGSRPRYVFFWGHTPAAGGALGKECLSQWYPAPFDEGGVRFATAEHYMMWSKAMLFGDEASAATILEAATPGAAKALGRGVKGFASEVWDAQRSEIVLRGSVAKFSQNAALGRFLQATGDGVLVEASPTDAVWGIGLAADDARATDPAAWRGLNLLGFALMEARAKLRTR